MWGFEELVKYIFKNSSSFNIVFNPYCPWHLSVINMIMFHTMFYDPWDQKQKARQKIFKYL